MHERNRTRTRIFWKILGIVLISIIFCVLVTSGFMYFYMKPLVENSLIEKRRDMVLNLSEQEVNTLEEISLYAMNITFDDTVQNIFKIEEPENSYMFFCSDPDDGKETERISNSLWWSNSGYFCR